MMTDKSKFGRIWTRSCDSRLWLPFCMPKRGHFGAFSQGRKSSRRKGWGCKCTPTRLTSDGNADRFKVLGDFEVQIFRVQYCALGVIVGVK